MAFFQDKKNIVIFSLIALVVFMLAIAGGCGSAPAPKPMPDNNTPPNAPAPSGKIMTPRIVLGYYENPWPNTPDTVGSLPSMKTFGKNMSAIAPYWYRATEEGELDSKYSKQAHDAAKSMNLKVYPLITNVREATDSLLGDSSVRSKLADNIVKLVREQNYDGINIDFELLPPKHRDNLTAFMAELYPKMAAMNKTLIISVFPQVDVAEDVSGAYDYPALAQNADFLQIMTYDKHWATSEPGPIAPIGWYEDNLKNAIEKCGGAHKVIIGIGVYGYNWEGAKGETITYVDAITLAEKKGVGIMYDEKNQAPYFKYKEHEVWFENAQSIEAKLNIIQKYQPAGIAIWRLGQEQPEIWPLINSKFPKGNINIPGANILRQNNAETTAPDALNPAPAAPNPAAVPNPNPNPASNPNPNPTTNPIPNTNPNPAPNPIVPEPTAPAPGALTPAPQ